MDWAVSWNVLLDTLAESTDGLRDDGPHVCLEGVLDTSTHWSLCETHRAAIWPVQATALDDLLLWKLQPERTSLRTTPSDDRLMESGRTMQEKPGKLLINLYANAGARAAQEAVVASLPPARRVEVFLSGAQAEQCDSMVSEIQRAWTEDGASCASVVLRHDGLRSVWPAPLLAPLLATLVDHDAEGWQVHFAAGFPPDAMLFDALWSGLCSPGRRARATMFWSWALGPLCVQLLSSPEPHLVSFALHVATRIALTLRAEIATMSAQCCFTEALALHISVKEGPLAASVGAAPLASLILSLVEVVDGKASDAPRGTESADEALAHWVGVVLDILNNPAIMDTPHALLQQLARARSCLALGVYARAHAVILGGESGNDGEIDLLAACILVQASNQKSNVSHACRAPNIQPLGVLSKALVSWPRQKLTVLVLQVLPEILDRCEVPTPNGPVQGCWLECCAPPFVDLPPESPVLKSVYCMLCCAAAQLHRDASLGGTMLRVAVDVVRACASSTYGSCRMARTDADVFLTQAFGAFLRSVCQALPDLMKPSPTDGVMADSPVPGMTLLSAALLLQSLMQSAASGGRADCLGALDPLPRQLEELTR